MDKPFVRRSGRGFGHCPFCAIGGTTLNFVTAPTSRNDRVSAAAISLVMIAVGLLALSVGKVPAAVMPSVLAVMIGAVIMAELLTALLLYGQLWNARIPSLAPLATAYLCTALLATVYIVTFPQVFSGTGLLGANEQTALLFWCVWHGVFPLLIGAFALSSRRSTSVWSASATGIAIAVSLLLSAVLVLATLFVATRVPGFPPQLIHNRVFSPLLTYVVLPAIVGLDVTCLATLTATRLRTTAQLWLFVAVLASLLDAMMGVVSFRYSVGWYVGKGFSVLSSGALITMFVFEITRLYHRLGFAQKELLDARDAAVDGAKSKMQFLATMSHEIRTPINAIIGINELLERTELDTEQREFAEIVHSSADVLLSVVNQVLDFSKLEAGKIQLHSGDFDLCHGVEVTADMIAGQVQAKGLALAVSVSSRIPILVRSDEMRLRQVLLNLLSNALKFTERGSIAIRAELEWSTPEHDVLSFTVTDTGMGIPSETLGALFSPFVQADSSTSRRFGGTGLGLSISKRIVEEMGGTIGVESTEGVGSQFRFTIRAEKAAIPTTSAAAPSKPLNTRILILGAAPAIGEAIAGYAAGWGATTHFGDMINAAEQFAAQECEAVIADLSALSATEVAAAGARLRAVFAAPTVTLIGLVGQEVPTQGALTASFSVVLRAPVHRQALYAALQGRVEAPAQPSGAKALLDKAHSAVKTAEASLLVLVVDDNAMNRKLALRQLAKLGINADAVSGGEAAVEALATHRYPVVLMDCQMPVVDGYEATRQIRARENGSNRCRIIAMTAGAFEEDRMACLAAGMDDYLAKPVTLRAMQLALEGWIPAAVV